MAETMSKDACPAGMGIFDDNGKPVLIAVWVLPEHFAKAEKFVHDLQDENGYQDPQRR